MANEKNLKPIQSTKEARERGKKGGIASGKARRRKKLLSDTVEMLVSLPLHEGKLDKLTSTDNINPDKTNITVEEAIILKQINKAVKGDIRAADFVISLIQQKQHQAEQHINTEHQITQQSENNTFIEALNGKAAEVWANEDTKE